MTVTAVTSASGSLPFTHTGDRLRITLPSPPAPGQELMLTVHTTACLPTAFG